MTLQEIIVLGTADFCPKKNYGVEIGTVIMRLSKVVSQKFLCQIWLSVVPF